MVVLFVGILLILYSLLSGKRYNLNYAFFFIFLIMGFQYNVQGDYFSYQTEFEHFTFEQGNVEKNEYFWMCLTYVFQKITSFPVFVCCLACVQCICVKSFIERFSNKDYLYISAIIFFFSFNFMLMQMKALRQGLAVDLCLFSFVLLDNQKRSSTIYAALLSLAAYFTHKSSLLCIMFVWGYYLFLKSFNPNHHKNKTINPWLLVAAILILYIFKQTFLDNYLIPVMEMLDDDHYSNYANDFAEYSVQMAFLPILYDCIIAALLAWYSKFATEKERYFIIVGIIGVFADVLLFATGSIQRLLLYFIYTNLIIFPSIARQLRIQYGNVAVCLFIILIVGYAFKTSIHSMLSTIGDCFGNYQFVFLAQ